MRERKFLPTFIVVLIPLGVATGILAAHTVGESIDHRNSAQIGFSVALLAMLAAGYFLFMDNTITETNSRFGIILVFCGTACVLLSVILQFYVAHLGGEHGRRLTEILADNLKRGVGVNINEREALPTSVSAISYLSLVIGAWIVAMGIRTGVSRRPAAPAGDDAPKTSDVTAERL